MSLSITATEKISICKSKILNFYPGLFYTVPDFLYIFIFTEYSIGIIDKNPVYSLGNSIKKIFVKI